MVVAMDRVGVSAVAAGGSALVRLRQRPDEGWSRLVEWWPGIGDVTGGGCRIAAHVDGALAFVSSETGQVTRLDGTGRVLAVASGSACRSVGASAMCVAGDDGCSTWIADPRAGRLVLRGADLRVERTMTLLPGCFGPGGDRTPGAPSAVAARDGLLLVADSRHAIGGLARFTEDGEWLGAVALTRNRRCAVPQPSAVALGAGAEAWAISGLNGRLYRIADDEAEPLGSPAAGPNAAATGVAVDEDGRVHVAVASLTTRADHRVVHLDGRGAVLGVTALIPGFHPVAIAAARGRLWVAGPGSDVVGFALPAAEAAAA